MIELTGENLTIEKLVAVARDHVQVAPLNESTRERMQRSHDNRSLRKKRGNFRAI